MSRTDPQCTTGIYHSPIKIDSKTVSRCNLLCSVEFIYTPPSPQSYQIKYNYKDLYHSSFLVVNTSNNHVDLKYNSESYYLQKIEFFTENIHVVDEQVYDAECHLLHRSIDGTKMLNVAIFLKSGYTFSYSQSFFQVLLPKTLDKSSHEQKIEIDPEWTPSTIIPPQKSFFIYRGDMIFAPCIPDGIEEITWIVMEHPVYIHTNEFHVLQTIAYKKSLTTPFLIANRSIYYNDGEFVTGNSLPGQVYVQCTKTNTTSFSSKDVDNISEPTLPVNSACYSYKDSFASLVLFVFLSLFFIFITYLPSLEENAFSEFLLMGIVILAILIFIVFNMRVVRKSIYLSSIIGMSILISYYQHLIPFQNFDGGGVDKVIIKILLYIPLGIFYIILLFSMIQMFVSQSLYSYRADRSIRENSVSVFKSLFDIRNGYFTVHNRRPLISKYMMTSALFLGMNVLYSDCYLDLFTVVDTTKISSTFIYHMGYQYDRIRQGIDQLNVTIDTPRSAFIAAFLLTLKNHGDLLLSTEDETTPSYLENNFQSQDMANNVFKFNDIFSFLS